jgi:hypothetical protein
VDTHQSQRQADNNVADVRVRAYYKAVSGGQASSGSWVYPSAGEEITESGYGIAGHR